MREFFIGMWLAIALVACGPAVRLMADDEAPKDANVEKVEKADKDAKDRDSDAKEEEEEKAVEDAKAKVKEQAEKAKAEAKAKADEAKEKVMGCIAQERVALEERFPYEIELSVFQVPQSAVDHAGKRRRTTRTEIVSLHEQHAQALQSKLAEGTDAVDAATDDHDVEVGVFAHRRELSLAWICHGMFTSGIAETGC